MDKFPNINYSWTQPYNIVSLNGSVFYTPTPTPVEETERLLDRIDEQVRSMDSFPEVEKMIAKLVDKD